MKDNKLIYLIAFLLSLSLILLLEASSLGLLAEDIKIHQKDKVEIELLLSASNNLGESTQNEVDQETSAENEPPSESETEEEVDKNSSEPKNEEITDVKNETVKKVESEEKIIEQEKDNKKEETASAEAQETEEIQEIEENQEVQETEEKIIEKKDPQEKVNAKNETKVDGKNEQPPAWLQNNQDAQKLEKSEEKVATKKEQNDKFDLESYLAELEEGDNDSKIDKNHPPDKKIDTISSENDSEVDNEESKASNKKNVENVNQQNSQTEAENKVYDLRKDADGIKKPGIKNYSQPEYPSNLRKRNNEGQVIVSLRIDTEGKIHDLEINESSGYESFDQAALNAVSEWNFEAAEKDGNKVEVIVNLPIRFELN
ncbi:MAG: energy transducer TonB [Halanaerobium sp.]